MNLALKIALIKDPRPAYKIAAEVGMSGSTLTRIVTGQRIPSIDQRRAIADVLGVDPSEIFPEQSDEDWW